MQDRTIGINCLISWLLWTLAAGLWAVGVVWSVRGLGSLAVMVAIGAATVTLRGILRDHDRGMKNALAGSPSARAASVRSLN